jgi:UDPglucose 6-dehydrogenase
MCEHISGCVQPRIPRLGLDLDKKIDALTEGFFAVPIQKNGKRLVGVIGLGSVGRALSSVMGYFHNVIGYDILGEHDWNPILSCEAVFICVQTPEGSDGRLDCSHVHAVLERLKKDRYEGAVVIKSTLRVGFMNTATIKYPDLKLVYSPEFMSEKNAFLWTANPDRIVISGQEELMDHVQKLYYWVENAKIIRTDFKSAEIGKLAHNALIALKVTFTNTMEQISKSYGASADDVMKIVYTDRRVANSAHFLPYKGPYGGKCVPKDTSELINAFAEMTQLLRVADDINNSLTLSKEAVNQELESE